MKLSVLLLISASLVAGCASSEKNSDHSLPYPNLVTLSKPPNNQAEATVYIDSVQAIMHNKSKELLIFGSFPDGCTRLKSAQHKTTEGTVTITLQAWRDSSSFCTQALTSFSFMYDKIPNQVLADLSSVTINARNYRVQ